MLQNSLQAQQEGGCIHKVCKLLGRPRQPLSDVQTLSLLPQERVPQNAENISSLKLIPRPCLQHLLEEITVHWALDLGFPTLPLCKLAPGLPLLSYHLQSNDQIHLLQEVCLLALW